MPARIVAAWSIDASGALVLYFASALLFSTSLTKNGEATDSSSSHRATSMTATSAVLTPKNKDVLVAALGLLKDLHFLWGDAEKSPPTSVAGEPLTPYPSELGHPKLRELLEDLSAKWCSFGGYANATLDLAQQDVVDARIMASTSRCYRFLLGVLARLEGLDSPDVDDSAKWWFGVQHTRWVLHLLATAHDKVGFAGKTTDAVFIPADVGARLRPLVADMYGADGAKSLLNRLAPMVDDQMLQG